MNKNNYLIELSESDRTNFGRIVFAHQSEPQKVFSTIWALESEVNNGGFLQYFASEGCNSANFAPTALHMIGAQKCAHIVERALRTLSADPLPDSSPACEALVNSLNPAEHEHFRALDSEFFTYPDNLTELLFAYVASHPETFGPTPK